jgi:tRNA (cytidine/uridine-2'-O-)-methyltransferase
VSYAAGDSVLFGSESKGLPDALVQTLPPHVRITLPMRPGNRSLNLSNAVAVTVFEAWRQLGFAGS